MKRIAFLLVTVLLTATPLMADSWEDITTSGHYYYGVGHGTTEAEALESALADLAAMIATHVSSEFVGIDDEVDDNGSVEHKSRVLNCVKTYSQSTLTNVEKWEPIGKAPDITQRCYIRRSELERIYDTRIEKAKDMVAIADESLQKGKVDMALQYYYWAYSLIRSLQRPAEVKGSNGRILMNWLPIKIDEILDDVSVTVEKRDGDFVDLLFNYKGEPVSSLEFTYSDGRAECHGSAKDGRGMIEMIPNYKTDVYHLSIDYEFKGQARGDAEMESVLNVITKKVLPKAQLTVSSTQQALSGKDKTGVILKPKDSQVVASPQVQADIVAKVVDAISSRNYSNAIRYFTAEGLERYNKLIAYGTGRVVGTPHIKFFKGMDGHTVARGMQMSFSFKSGTKKTFVEDVVFSLNSDNKIDNVAFGLGHVAETDILCKNASSWNDDTREMMMEFLENYKTAYCMKDINFLEKVFSDDAIIIVGYVAKRAAERTTGTERPVSLRGQDVIKKNQYTKSQYLTNLKRCFARNEFINIRFTNNDIQRLDKYENEELYGIQIGQEYNSSTCGDMGYLFLLVDMTDHQLPQIKVRTWQPNEVSMDKIYHAGWFYDE